MVKNVLVVSFAVLVGCIVPMLLVVPAQYLGVDMSTLQGSNTQLTLPNVVLILLFSAATIGVVYLFQRLYHRRPFARLGFKKPWLGDLVKGHVVGFALSGAVMLSLVVLGDSVSIEWAAPETVSGSTLLLYYFFFFFMLTLNSLKEELLFRSYPLENIGDHKGSRWVTILIVSALFSLVHLILEPPTWAAFFSRLLFGILTCQIYLHTRSIWPIIGVHSGWNWCLITFTGNWKLGGLFLLSLGDDTSWEKSSIVIVGEMVVLLLCIGAMEWIQRRTAASDDSAPTRIEVPAVDADE